MTDTSRDPWLLTPGPLTTSMETKKAMLHDWGSRDATFIDMTARVRRHLLEIAGAADTHVCVPVQGSGTFAVEATLGTVIPKNGKALVLINGAYGARMVKILDYIGRASVTYETPEDTPPNVAEIDALLAGDTSITHVLAVFCETTSGILNPVEDIADVVRKHGRSLLIDAMSAFGAIPLDAAKVPYDALMASSNKCLEGVPGMGFAIIRRSVLEGCKGHAHSLSLDLYDQWQGLEKNGQWRFTPPTHVLAAFDAAIRQFLEQGGIDGRNARYTRNCGKLLDGLHKLGFETLLADRLQAPIIVTVKMPEDPAFDLSRFNDALKDRGFVIYPGKVTVSETFRIGCIGALADDTIDEALSAIRDILSEMGVSNARPAAA